MCSLRALSEHEHINKRPEHEALIHLLIHLLIHHLYLDYWLLISLALKTHLHIQESRASRMYHLSSIKIE